jgi:dipeptidyl aminopeptidase/acylaminoacyl peptidase
MVQIMLQKSSQIVFQFKNYLSVSTVALALLGCSTSVNQVLQTQTKTQTQTQASSVKASAHVIEPNKNLFVQGLPELEQSLADQVAAYTDFRGYSFVDWHPTKKEMLVSHRKGSTAQLFLVTAPMAEPVQITDFTERVSSANFEPREGKYIVLERASGGNEVTQLYRMDLASKQTTLLTNPDERHDMAGWNNAGDGLLFSSVPVDRTAQGGTRASISTTLKLMNPLKPENARTIAQLPGGGWWGFEFSPNDQQILAIQYLSAAQSEIWLIDAASGKTERLLPEANSSLKATHFHLGFSGDGAQIYLSSDRQGEFGEVMVYDRATKQLKLLGEAAKNEMTGATINRAHNRLVKAMNVDGANQLQIRNLSTGQLIEAPKFPVATVGQLAFHPATNQLAFAVNSAQGPSDIFVFTEATASSPARTEAWTKAYAPASLRQAQFSAHSVIRWKSFDGLTISGLRVQPPASFAGKRPVLIDIHGGPEAQSRPGFMGRLNYLINELGIAVIQPNVRGSRGYGKTFLTLDDGYKREDSVKDIGALLDWIAQQPDLDASRVMVMGGSYGGYMSLASAVHYSNKIVGAIDVVGISNFVTFLESTESYRRDLRRVEYGDERDPAMRAFQQSISPLTNAQKIKTPLFVIQGRNDPRVPYTEAEQIVSEVRKNGTTVWYLRAENEGHGFARKENADFQFYAMVAFIRTHLLK